MSKTYTTSARLSITTLAALIEYYKTKGIEPTSRNEALNIAFEHLADALNLERPTHHEAIHILKDAGLYSNKNGTQGLREELQKESLQEDFNPDTEPVQEQDDGEKTLEDWIKEAQEKLK
jgi:hypothetical protein